MIKNKPFVEHSGKAVETDERFKHVMALTLDPFFLLDFLSTTMRTGKLIGFRRNHLYKTAKQEQLPSQANLLKQARVLAFYTRMLMILLCAPIPYTQMQ